MQQWVIYAILSAIFAGITAILAKYGLQNVSADFGLGIRTTVIFVIVLAINIAGDKFKEFVFLTSFQKWLLIASGVTTTLSWFFYDRALKDGPVSYVAMIDKASILITLALSFLLLKEPFTPKVAFGALLILAGILIMTWK